MVFLQSLMLITAGAGAIHYAFNSGAIEIPDIDIETPDFGVTETIERLTMMMVISTACMVVLAVTFTYLYPKWK